MKRSTYKKILDACRAHGTVVQGRWGVECRNYDAPVTEDGWSYPKLETFRQQVGCTQCALGAFLIGKPVREGDPVGDVASILGITELQVDSFTAGFDDDSEDPSDEPEFFEAGARMAKTLIREGILL